MLRFYIFSPCSVNSSVKLTFFISLHAANTQLDISKNDFIKPSFNHAKIIFPSEFLFSFSIRLSNPYFVNVSKKKTYEPVY